MAAGTGEQVCLQIAAYAPKVALSATDQLFSNGFPAAQDHIEHCRQASGCASLQRSVLFRIFNLSMPKKQIGRHSAVTRAQRTLDRMEKTGATFLITDLDVAMTLTRIAGDAAPDSEKRSRNLANARHAYDDVLRISRHAALTDPERHDVDGKLAELRSALEQLGEVFA